MARRLGAVALMAALMTAQTAFAGDGTDAPAIQPLAPGKAAGIHVAQTDPDINKVVIAAGIGLAAVAVYLIVGTHYNVHSQHHAHAQQAASGTR